jgi:hypothetical protein
MLKGFLKKLKLHRFSTNEKTAAEGGWKRNDE